MHRIKAHICTAALLFGLVLGVHGEHIALLENSRPVQVFPYKLTMFPAEDQITLCKGIHVKDENHLEILLQDFLS